MTTDSTAVGFLASSAANTYDDELEDQLQETIVGITGIAGSLVRPRWQPEPSQLPSFTSDWVAFGITSYQRDTFAYTNQASSSTTVERDEVLTVMHSFYGPNCDSMCSRFSDGLQVPQNRDALMAVGIAVVEVRDPNHLPALLKEKWVRRTDVQIIYRRRTSRTYPVLSLLSAQGSVNAERYSNLLTVNQ